MDMSSMNGIIDVLVLVFGVYALLAYYKLKVKGEIMPSVLISKEADPKKCKDLEAYRSFICPRLLIFSIGVMFCGILGILFDYTDFIPFNYYMIIVVVFLLLIVWFGYNTRKAFMQYWPQK